MEKLVFGTAAFSGSYGLSTSREAKYWEELVREALKLGIHRFDTAPVYGDAEAILGCALGSGGEVWTKLSGIEYRKSVEQSIKNLDRSQIDLLQYHNWSRDLLDDQKFISTWQDLRRDERFKRFGASTYGVQDAVCAALSGLFDVVQIEWNVLNQSVLMAVMAVNRSKRVQIAVRSIYLQGVLTDEGRKFSGMPVLCEGAERARKWAKKQGKSLNQLILGHALAAPEIDYVLVGFETCEQIKMAVDVQADYLADMSGLDLQGHPETDPRNWGAAR